MDAKLAARLDRVRLLSHQDLAALPANALPEGPIEHKAAPGGGVQLVPDVAGAASDASSSSTIDASKRAASPEAATEQSKAEDPVSTNDRTQNTEKRFILVSGVESSFNLGSKPNLSALPARPLQPTLLQRSELAAPHEKFTPIVALSRYPYKFCSKDHMQDIASAIFDQGKFWAREWDLFYLWDIEESKPLILVREEQVLDILAEINSQLKLKLKITDSQREEGFVLRFPDHPRCRPRYLGRSHNKNEYYSMIDQVPHVSVRAPGELAQPPLVAQTLEDFKQMIEDAWEIQKAKSKASREKRRVDRMKKLKVFSDQLKRAQRNLGLRPTHSGDVSVPTIVPAIDVTHPAPFPYDRSVVFVCVDVEAYERDHRKITEVGVATLDTRDLVGIAPGPDGEAWRSFIKARHFRIQEYSHLVNGDFVAGCPGSFFFGESEFVRVRDLAATVAACFAPPFCTKPEAGSVEEVKHDEPRNLVFLGHNAIADIKYLQTIGFDPLVLPNLLEAQDSAELFRVWKRAEHTTSLEKVLREYQITPHGLHNAGNDAVYTVQSFLATCVRDACIRNAPETKKVWEDLKESKIAFEEGRLRSDMEKDAAIWDDIEGTGDGGEPVPITIKKPSTSKRVLQPLQTGTENPAIAQNENKAVVREGEGVSVNTSSPTGSNGWGGKAAW